MGLRLFVVVIFGLFTVASLMFTGFTIADWVMTDNQNARKLAPISLTVNVMFIMVFIYIYSIYTRTAIELKIHNAITGEHVTGVEWVLNSKRLDTNFYTRIVTGYGWTAVMGQYVTTIKDIDQRDVLIIRSINGNKDINDYLMHNNTLPLSKLINSLPPLSMTNSSSGTESQSK